VSYLFYNVCLCQCLDILKTFSSYIDKTHLSVFNLLCFQTITEMISALDIDYKGFYIHTTQI